MDQPTARTIGRAWRITAGAPKGERGNPADTTAPAETDAAERLPGNWLMSSFDLLHGADITEFSDTVPDTRLDELLPARDGGAKIPGR